MIGFLILVPFFSTSQTTEKACFSVPGGFYEESFTLEIFPFYQNHHIRFTTNGNRPTAQSRLYTEPLRLDGSLYSTSDIYTIQTSPAYLMYYPDSVEHCIVIRAAVFDENDSCISEVSTNSYFIHSLGCDTHGLPVVSLCADSLDLFDFEHGIMVPGVHFNPQNPNWTGNYYQSGIEWERLANMEFYELTDNTGINQLAGLRTHGGNARRSAQKGLKVYAREEYGNKRFHHAFFETLPNNSFKHLVLKPFTDQWFSTGIPNMICQRMASDVNVESLGVLPSVLFLNGEYWGIYSVCERPDTHYLEDHFGYDNESFNVIGDWNGSCDDGDNTRFLQLISWLQNSDLSNDANYEYLCSLVDMDCFIDYYCLELFVANDDWPANNMKCYQHHDGKWRWIFYDGDNGLRNLDFDVFANATTSTPGSVWPNSMASTLMFGKLVTNRTFLTRFTTRFYQLMADQFSYEHTKPYFDFYSDLVRPEVPDQAFRFGKPIDLEHWEGLIAQRDLFLSLRVDDMMAKINQFLSVDVFENTRVFSCSPNPSSGSITLVVSVDSPRDSQIQVYDVFGRQQLLQTVSLDGGTNVITMDLPLIAGLYLLKMDRFVTKIVLQ